MTNNLIILPPTDRSTRRSSFWPDWRKVKRNCLILLSLFLIAYIGLHIGVKIWTDRILNNSRFSSMREFWNSDVNFPKEWEAIPDISLVMKKDRNDSNHPLYQISLAIGTWNNLHNEVDPWIRLIKDPNEVFTQDDWDAMQKLLGQLDGEFHTGLDVIQKLGQEIGKNSITEYLPTILNQDYAFECLQHAITLKAFVLAHEGKYSEAVDTQMASLPIYIHESVPGIEYGEISLGDWITSLLSQVANVWDEQPLQSGLDQLNRWEPYLFRMKKEHAQLYSLYSMLTQYQLPIHYGKNIKAYEYYRNLNNVQHPPKRIAQVLTALYNYSNQWLFGISRDNLFTTLWEAKFELIQPFLLTRTVEELYMAGLYDDSAMGIYELEQGLGNRYDALRLAIASKLYFLRNQKHPARMADLVPDYFPSEINDRLTGKPVTWTNEEKK